MSPAVTHEPTHGCRVNVEGRRGVVTAVMAATDSMLIRFDDGEVHEIPRIRVKHATALEIDPEASRRLDATLPKLVAACDLLGEKATGRTVQCAVLLVSLGDDGLPNGIALGSSMPREVGASLMHQAADLLADPLTGFYTSEAIES